jgi:hypothetical protein
LGICGSAVLTPGKGDETIEASYPPAGGLT